MFTKEIYENCKAIWGNCKEGLSDSSAFDCEIYAAVIWLQKENMKWDTCTILYKQIFSE